MRPVIHYEFARQSLGDLKGKLVVDDYAGYRQGAGLQPETLGGAYALPG